MDWIQRMIECVKVDDFEQVNHLLQNVPENLSLISNTVELSPLHIAIASNNISIVRLLAEQKSLFDKPSALSRISPVLQAVSNTDVDLEILRTLITSGFNVTTKDATGRSALHIAADLNYLDRLEIVLTSSNIHINQKDRTGRNALHCIFDKAPFENFKEFTRGIQMLLDKDVDVTSRDNLGETPLHYVFRNYCRYVPRVFTYVLKHSPDARLDLQDEYGSSVFHEFLSNVSDYIEEREDYEDILEEREIFIREFLCGNIVKRDPEYIKNILNRRNANGYSAFQAYVDNTNYTTETVDQMISSGADVTTYSSLGITALMNAVVRKRDEIVEKLLIAGANVNAHDIFGQTALFRVKTTRSFDLLCEYGARLDIKDKFGRLPVALYTMYTPEDLPSGCAIHLSPHFSNFKPLAAKFFSLGTDVNTVDIFGSSLLHYAAWYGITSAVDMLMAHGINPHIADNKGFTAYDVAVFVGNFEIAQRLEECNDKTEVHLLRTVDDLTKLKNIVVHEGDVTNLHKGLTKLGIDKHPPVMIDQIINSPAFGIIEKRPGASDVKTSILEMMSKLAHLLEKEDYRFKSTLFPTGSSAESTKVCDPSEFDFVFCLDFFSDKCNIMQPSDLCGTGFALLNLTDTDTHGISSFLSGHSLICSNIVRNKFYDCIINVVNRAEFWDFDNIYFDGLVQIQGHKPILNIQVEWFGQVYKHVIVSIDIVPAVYLKSWIPQEVKAKKHPWSLHNDQNAGYFALFHPPEEHNKENYVRISCAPLEIHFFHTSPAIFREVYAAAKLLNFFSPLVQFDDTDSWTTEDDSQSQESLSNETEEIHGSHIISDPSHNFVLYCGESGKEDLKPGCSYKKTSDSWLVKLDDNLQVQEIYFPKDGVKETDETKTKHTHIHSYSDCETSDSNVATICKTENNTEQKSDSKHHVKSKINSPNVNANDGTTTKSFLKNVQNDISSKISVSNNDDTASLKGGVFEEKQVVDDLKQAGCGLPADANNEDHSNAEVIGLDCSELHDTEWEGGDIRTAKDVISSYMMKNCLFYVMEELKESKVSSEEITHIELIKKMYRYLKSCATHQCLPAYCLPRQNVFTYVNSEIRQMEPEDLTYETAKLCKRISTFCDVILEVLSFSPEEICP
ncbi:uncharacterized protein LOC117122596 [Anneissia japonica]|uniref:uncharacterized protein LOC117122596 n=1 Tax=Anneissia japonica TaxID=1529436 RepID=UPI001425A5D7|nr:uncharacterized protein LOC117122596 [Anneissia japonica]